MLRPLLSLVFVPLFQLAAAANVPRYSDYSGYGSPSGSQAWSHLNIESFVTFGDSYTDELRLSYFQTHNGSAPPPGTILGVGNATSDGGYIWDRYVVWYLSNAHKSVKLYNYAVSGAVCSNNLTPRYTASINAPFPDIEGYELPAFYADYHTGVLEINPSSTVYGMWIGTNDLGTNALLTDSQVTGKTVIDYLDCVYDSIDKIYASPINARYFVLMNIAPLQLVPMYQLQNISGLDEGYENATETHYRMEEQVLLVNEVYEWRTMAEAELKKRWPGMKIAVFDVNSLLTDIYYNPTAYLNGTAPANVTGYVNHCNANGTDCTQEPSRDSFEWYDPLHPSEQTDRNIAKEFVKVTQGTSKYAMYLSD